MIINFNLLFNLFKFFYLINFFNNYYLMAFVYRSNKENKRKLYDNTSNNIGPGSYLSHTSYNIKNNDNKHPFMSGSKKMVNFINKEALNPGPGSYFKSNNFNDSKDKLELFKNLNINYANTNNNYNNLYLHDNGSKNSIYKILDYDEITKNSKFSELLQEKIKPTGFLIKDKRFKENNNNDVPGPGHYNRNDLNYFSEDTDKNKLKSYSKTSCNFSLKKVNNIKNKEFDNKTNKWFNGPVSIPSKIQSFGYKLAGNSLIQNNNGKDSLYNEVSPFSYDIYGMTYNAWIKKTLPGVWSRSKTKKSLQIENNENEAFYQTDNFSNINTKYGNFNYNKLNKNTNLKKDNIKNNFNNSCNNYLNNTLRRNMTVYATIKNNKQRKHNYINNNNTNNTNNKNDYILAQRKELERTLFKIQNEEHPGPGYYNHNIISVAKSPPESFQCFGSKTTRFNNPIVNEEEEIPGPGSYFNRNEHKKNKRKRLHTIKANLLIKQRNNKYIQNKECKSSIFKNNTTTDFSSNNESSIYNNFKSTYKIKDNKSNINKDNGTPGPGEYNPNYDNNYHKNKLQSKTKGVFGSSEVRFIKKISEQINKHPDTGPGSYLGLYEYNKKLPFTNPYKSNIKKGHIFDIDENNIKRKAEINNKLINRDNNKMPSVGMYNPDKVYNIQNKLIKNINKISSVFVPFNSQQRRFDKIKKDKYKQNIGPGYYYKENNVEYTQKGKPFNTTVSKGFEFPLNNKLGPGDYNLNSYFDWNKKSYNVYFV